MTWCGCCCTCRYHWGDFNQRCAKAVQKRRRQMDDCVCGKVNEWFCVAPENNWTEHGICELYHAQK